VFCIPVRRQALDCALSCLIFLLFLPAAPPCQAQETVLRPGDSVFSRDVTLADAAKYLQLGTDGADQSLKFWTSFRKSLPGSAENFKNALTMLVLVDTMLSGPADPKRFHKALKTVLDFGAGAFVTAYEDAGYMPLATVNTLFTLYNESLIFFRDRVFLPGLADEFYDVYKSHRLGSGLREHEAAWNLTHIPEPVVADVALSVVLKAHGVQPGLYEGLKFDKEHLAKAARSAEGKAAGRTIRIDAQPGTDYSGRSFLINRDIGERIEIKAGFVQGYEQQMLSIMTTITSRDMDQRADAHKTGYKPLSASDEKAVETEIRVMFERMKVMDMGEKLREEAVAHIGNTFRLRYERELAEQVLRERAAVAKKVLAAEAARLRAYARVRLVTVRGLGPDGEPVPLDEAALFVDGSLCRSETNGGKPCATNRFGLAALHLPPGGHDVQARAPGFKPAEIRIFADTPDTASAPPEEYEVLLEPDTPRDVTIALTSGEDGPPLAGARLNLHVGNGAPLAATTDQDGQALFAAVPPVGPYRLDAQADAHAPGSRNDPDLSAGPLRFFLEPYRTEITVLALDLDGAPLAGATIRIGEHELPTDAQGLAVFKKMRPSPEGGYTLTGRSSGLPPVSQTLAVRPTRPDETLRVELPFKVKTGILAVVRDASDRVVPGAVVVVDGADGPSRHTTDANGYLRLQDVGLGGHYLHAEAPGYQPAPDAEVLVSVDQPMHKVRLELRTGVTLKALALGPDGSPVAGATLTLDNGKGVRAPAGSATFAYVQPGKHVLTASSDLGSVRLELDVSAQDGPVRTVELRLAPVGGSVVVQARGADGKPVTGVDVILLKNGKPFGKKAGNGVLFDNLTEGYYTAEVTAASHNSATSEPRMVRPGDPAATITVTLPAREEEQAAPGKLQHMLKERVAENTYQYSGISLRMPDGSSRKLAFSQEDKGAPLAAFCATVDGAPAPKQRMPHVGSTAGKTYDLSGRQVCDGKAQGGVTCATYMSITCVVRPECKPGDPKCDPEAPKPTPPGAGTPPPGNWSYSSYGSSGQQRTYRFVRLGGNPLAATDALAPAAFCRSKGLSAAPQPSGNTTNWQGQTVNASGQTVCRTKKAGGTESVCPAYRDITCTVPQQAPCDPNDPLCGLDKDL
jgi:hypothetical protein